MKTLNDDNDSSRNNVIDATERLRPEPAPRLKVLKAPAMTPDERKVVVAYVAARRMEQRGAARAADLKHRVLSIVRTRKQVAVQGAVVSLDHSYTYHYSETVGILAKTLSEHRALERENGTAKALVNETVAFEDVRRREKERRERATAKVS